MPYAAAPPETTQATLNLPSLSFSAALPPEARDLEYFLPTTQLKIHQQWSARLAHLRVGDSISRTVVVTAQKTQAMFIPPLQFPAPEGIRVYPKTPSVENQKSPIGEFLAGVRTERTSYLLTKPGDYTLREVKITWWNLGTHKLTSSVLPAATIHVDAADAYVSELPPEPPPLSPAPVAAKRREYRLLLTLAVATVVFLPLFALALRRWGPLLVRRCQAARDRWHNSEPANFHRLKQALHRNNATQSYALLIAWIRRRCPGMTLDQFQTEVNDPRLDQQLLGLSRFLFAPSRSSSWQDGPSLAAFLARYRRRSLARIYRSTVQLPPLNPSQNRQTILS